MATTGVHPYMVCSTLLEQSDHGTEEIEGEYEKEFGERRNYTLQEAEQAIEEFIRAQRHPSDAPQLASSAPELPKPVVIPQRRPGNRERGFVKAYAPVLRNFSIQEDTFNDFISATNRSLKASKWISAIQLAAMGTSFVPNSVAFGVSIGVQVIAAMVAHTEYRWKTNSFLERINNEFFRPRGLFCLLVSYNPIATGKEEQVEDAGAVSKALQSSPDDHFLARVRKNLRNPVAATAEGENGLPPSVAPLIWSDSSPENRGQQEDKDRSVSKRLNDYLDKRAQARYATESHGDVLSNPSPPQFKNRYLDPNHPANTGGLIGLISGGKLTPDPERTKPNLKLAFYAQQKAIEDTQAITMSNLHQQLDGMNLSDDEKQNYIQMYSDAYELQSQQIQQQADMVEKGQIQRRIIKNILYLMIVKTPSEEEMVAARHQIKDSSSFQANKDLAIKGVQV